MTGARCPKCGMLQMPSATCKSCGATLGGRASPSTPERSVVGKAETSPLPRQQPTAKRTSILTILGAIFAGLITLGVIGFAVIYYFGSGLDKESKAHVDQLIPGIVTSWNSQDLIRHASPELLQVAPVERIDGLFRLFSARLGPLKEYKGSKGEAFIGVTLRGITVTANYVAGASFEKAPATIQIRMIQRGSRWQVLEFRVHSDALIQ